MSKLFSLFANLRWPSRKESSPAQRKLTPMKSLSSSLWTAVCQSRKAIGELKTAIDQANEAPIPSGISVTKAWQKLIDLVGQFPIESRLALLTLVLGLLMEEESQSQAEPRKGQSEAKPWQHEG